MTGDPSPAPLARIEAIATELDEAAIRDDARLLAERAVEGRFYVAGIGQFKRGKSTLVDALIGRAILPADVVPVTAVPTVVRYGETWSARVRMAADAWQDIPLEALADYVSEERNPENAKGVRVAEVTAPAPLLQDGMCLVDTPGLGSVFAGNAEATRAFVPHIDAAIVVVGADPPISGDELQLVEAVAAQAAHLIVVLNKADRVAAPDRAAAVAFTRTVLERRLGRPVGSILEVSALERLESRGPPRDWPRLVETLERLAGDSGASLVERAVRRGERRLSHRLLDAVAQRRSALTQPVEESERRTAALADAAQQAERWLGDLGVVLAAEQSRLVAELDARRTAWVAEVQRRADADLSDRLRAIRGRWGPKRRRDAMAAALDVARRAITPWLVEQQELAGAAFAERTSRFRELEREFAQRVAGLGVPELSDLLADTGDDGLLAGRVKFQFQPLLHRSRPASPIRHAADIVLASTGGGGVILHSAREFLAWLLELNASRVAADVRDRLAESRRRLEREVRTRLQEVQDGATRALERAVTVRAAGADRVRSELARLDALDAAVRDVAS